MPQWGSFISGISVAISLGAAHRLEKGAVAQRVVALHVSIERGLRESVSTRVAALRRLLLNWDVSGEWFAKAAKVRGASSSRACVFTARLQGEIPLVIEVASGDIMATLLELKSEVEEAQGSKLRLVFSGATEAHLLAPALCASFS